MFGLSTEEAKGIPFSLLLIKPFLISRSRVLTNAEIYPASVIAVAPLAEIV